MVSLHHRKDGYRIIALINSVTDSQLPDSVLSIESELHFRKYNRAVFFLVTAINDKRIHNIENKSLLGIHDRYRGYLKLINFFPSLVN